MPPSCSGPGSDGDSRHRQLPARKVDRPRTWAGSSRVSEVSQCRRLRHSRYNCVTVQRNPAGGSSFIIVGTARATRIPCGAWIARWRISDIESCADPSTPDELRVDRQRPRRGGLSPGCRRSGLLLVQFEQGQHAVLLNVQRCAGSATEISTNRRRTTGFVCDARRRRVADGYRMTGLRQANLYAVTAPTCP